jgi:hypothetical protein
MKKPRGGRPGASVGIPSTTDRRELTEGSTLSLDRDSAERFLTALDQDATFFTFQTFDDNRERKKAFDKANVQRKKEGKSKLPDPYVRVLHGTLKKYWDELARLNEIGAGIFVTINETDGMDARECRPRRNEARRRRTHQGICLTAG